MKRRRMWLSEQEVKLIKSHRASKKSASPCVPRKCRYISYDAEGAHCSIGAGEGIGNYCRLYAKQFCSHYSEKSQKDEVKDVARS